MRIQATKKFTSELNRALRAEKMPYHAHFIECDYSACSADYNAKTGRYNCVMIEYPPEYYAIPQYLTTYDLIREYRPRDTIQTYFRRLIQAIEI